MIRPQRSGVAAVELALTLPLYFLLMGGIVDFGQLFYQRSTLDASVADGCRAGTTQDPGPGLVNIGVVQTYAETRITTRFAEESIDPNIFVAPDVTIVYDTPVRSLRCTASASYTPLWGVLPTVELESTLIMRMEFQR